MSKEYTKEEVQEKVINHILHLIEYWDENDQTPETVDKLEGLAFSILSMFDGSTMDIPQFIIAPDPHPSDKEYLRSVNSNWYTENHNSDVKCNIGGYLHELLFPAKKLRDEKRARNKKIDNVLNNKN